MTPADASRYLYTPNINGVRPLGRLRLQMQVADTLAHVVPEPRTLDALKTLRDAGALPGVLVMLSIIWDEQWENLYYHPASKLLEGPDDGS